MMVDDKSNTVKAILVLALLAVPFAMLYYGSIGNLLNDLGSKLTGQGSATMTIQGELLKNGQVVRTWDGPSNMLAIMFGNTRIDIDPSQGSYELRFTPRWTIRVANVSEDQWTARVTVTSVTQSWKGTTINDVTPIGVSNTAQATKSRSETAVNLTCAKRVFGCDYVVSNPPPVGGSADYKITYNYKVELYVGNTLVDTKTGQATATATFTNTISGTLSSISVSVQSESVYTPLYIGF
jgi:hypothetical protein